jgi:hypothetical protein
VVAAALQAGSLSELDIVLLGPTLEALGLLDIPAIRARWSAATRAAEGQRTANLAARMTRPENAAVLEAAAEAAVKRAVAEVGRGLRVYVIVDISGSMQGAIEEAKRYLERLVAAFPFERVHVSVFNTVGRELVLRHASVAGVAHAFTGISAGGGTDYGQGVLALAARQPAPDEDALFIFVGDEQAYPFHAAVVASGLRPVAFAMVHVGGEGSAVHDTAAELGVPIFALNPQMFDDAYAVPRILRDLIASTPVRLGKARRSALDEVLATPLLQRPVWA